MPTAMHTAKMVVLLEMEEVQKRIPAQTRSKTVTSLRRVPVCACVWV
jgi:hypothetical protein